MRLKWEERSDRLVAYVPGTPFRCTIYEDKQFMAEISARHTDGYIASNSFACIWTAKNWCRNTLNRWVKAMQ